jgi:cytochrome c oxidase cbb3-type subunit 3
LLLRVPVTGIVPGNRAVAPDIKNPLEDDADAATRGMKAFDTFNCSGCHAANGAGGMGPALSNDSWVHRSSTANIYLSIAQGRSRGMPAFGTLLPERTIWELVSYVQSIAEKPSGQFGKTISLDPPSPDRQQVSANRLQTPTPWRYTEPMSWGQRPK